MFNSACLETMPEIFSWSDVLTKWFNPLQEAFDERMDGQQWRQIHQRRPRLRHRCDSNLFCTCKYHILLHVWITNRSKLKRLICQASLLHISHILGEKVHEFEVKMAVVLSLFKSRKGEYVPLFAVCEWKTSTNYHPPHFSSITIWLRMHRWRTRKEICRKRTSK